MTENDYILLNDYLDGALDDGREEEFFGEVARNPVLRRELNGSLRLRTALRMEAASVIPPADLSSSVFASLGYAQKPANILGAAFLQWGGYLGAALTGALLVWFLLQFGNMQIQPQGQSVSQQLLTVRTDTVVIPAPAQQLQTSPPSFAKEEATVPDDERAALNKRIATLEAALRNQSRAASAMAQRESNRAEQDNQERSILASERDELARRLAEAQSALATLNEQQRLQQNQELQASEQRESRLAEQSNTLQQTLGFETGSPMRPVQFARQSELQKQRPVEVSVRQLLLRSSSNVAVESNDNLGLYNVAVQGMLPDVLPRIIPGLALGIEFGREQFVQQYRDVLNGQTATITQRPTLWWGGVAARYGIRTGIFDNAVMPIVQAGGGLAESGFYYRAAVGLRYEPVQSVALTIGFEQAWLNYRAGLGTYLSTQNGFTTGIGFQF